MAVAFRLKISVLSRLINLLKKPTLSSFELSLSVSSIKMCRSSMKMYTRAIFLSCKSETRAKKRSARASGWVGSLGTVSPAWRAACRALEALGVGLEVAKQVADHLGR